MPARRSLIILSVLILSSYVRTRAHAQSRFRQRKEKKSKKIAVLVAKDIEQAHIIISITTISVQVIISK
jgi:hypothetical protein